MSTPLTFAELYQVGSNGNFTPAEAPEDLDPRGLLIMSEPPSSRETYVLGCDPTVGIVGWNRHLKTRDDLRIDNGAIEVIRVGRNGGPDVQVAEYAAPIDPEELADVVNMVGRLYAGNDENGQCQAIIEVYPGPGLMTQRKLLNTYGYTNLFVWKYLDSMSVKMSTSFGWQTSQKSRRDLWIRGTRHITLKKIRILSPYLVEELAHCEADQLKMAARAASGKHDDRAIALLMAIWAANEWSMNVETQKIEVTTAKKPEWQSSAVSVQTMYESWQDKFADLQED
jgi:hypothetical protein